MLCQLLRNGTIGLLLQPCYQGLLRFQAAILKAKKTLVTRLLLLLLFFYPWQGPIASWKNWRPWTTCGSSLFPRPLNGSSLPLSWQISRTLHHGNAIPHPHPAVPLPIANCVTILHGRAWWARAHQNARLIIHGLETRMETNPKEPQMKAADSNIFWILLKVIRLNSCKRNWIDLEIRQCRPWTIKLNVTVSLRTLY